LLQLNSSLIVLALDALISFHWCNLCLLLLPAAFCDTEIAEREDDEADDDVEASQHLADGFFGEERGSGEPLSTREPGVLFVVPQEDGDAGDDRADESAVRHDDDLKALEDAGGFGVLDHNFQSTTILSFEATN
jgi:hypothetical protein